MSQVQMAGTTMATNSGVLTATGAETVIDHTVAIQTCINGASHIVPIGVDEATPTTDVNTGETFVPLAASEGCYFVYMTNSTLGYFVAQGTVHKLAGTTGADEDFVGENILPQYPSIPDGYCPFAIQMIKNDSGGSAWTFGATDWTTVNGVIQDILTMPDVPQDMTTASLA